MREIFSREDGTVSVLAARPGDHIYVEERVGPTVDDVAVIEDRDFCCFEVIFDKYALVVVEGLDSNCGWCTNLRFARLNRPASERLKNIEGQPKRRVLHSGVIGNSYFAAALYNDGYEPIEILGGAGRFGLAFAMDNNGQGAEVMVACPTQEEWWQKVSPEECERIYLVCSEDLDNALYDLNAQNEVEAGDAVRVEDRGGVSDPDSYDPIFR